MGVLRNPLRSPLRSPIYGPLEGKWGGGVIYDPDASALFARFTTPPTDARKTLINNLIVSLKAAGVWAKLDALYVTAAADSQAARRNWIADQYNLTAVNAPTFVADRGYTGNGSSSYLDTGFNPTTASSPKFTQNSANMGLWSRTNTTGVNSWDFGNVGSYFVRANAIDVVQGSINNNANPKTLGAYPGHNGWSRTTSLAWKGYRNGSETISETNWASAALVNANFRMGGIDNSNWGIQQIATGYFGSSLTGAEETALHAALNTYLQAVGAA